MSSSPTTYENKSPSSERRSGSREPLKWVVLVYFGLDNWGKLIDLSESGMRFEFAQPPSDRERINFTFEAMGCLPGPSGGEVISDSFQVVGDVRWTRDFERTAGVQFVILPEESRQQIRKWLSFDTFSVSVSANAITEPQAPAQVREPAEALPAPSEALPSGYENESQMDVAPVESGAALLVDPTSALMEKILEAPAFQDYSRIIAEEEKQHAEATGTSPRISRKQVISVLVGLGVIFVIGGISMILPRLTREVPAVEPTASPIGGDHETLGAERDSATGSRRPFLVEVLDANNRRWLLWFDNSSKNAPAQAAYRSAAPSSLDSVRRASRPKQPAASPKAPVLHKFTLNAPKPGLPPSNTSTANSPFLAAPVVRDELQAPLEAPIASVVTGLATPALVAGQAPMGGQVQLAHLLKSVPPVYPAFARSSHVEGDVAIDAFIDANGNVTELKVLSGPPILRQAAMDAIRQWKYDPARLDGRPMPIRLGLTVRFRFQ